MLSSKNGFEFIHSMNDKAESTKLISVAVKIHRNFDTVWSTGVMRKSVIVKISKSNEEKNSS